MKHLNYLLILFLIGIFIASCQKEEQVLDVELPSIEDRGSIASAQRFKLDDYRGCYNDMMTQVKRKSFEEQFGEPAKVEIIYKNTYGYSTVYPLMTDRTVTTLLWVNGINDGYFIPQNASLSKDEIAGTNITRGVSAIFNLSYTQLDPNSSVREIQKTLGDNFLVSKKRSQITIEEISEISEKANDKTIASKQIKPMCDNAELADLYFIMFGFHDESGGFPDYVFPQSVMIEAINTIINANGGYCICPIPCYLQQVLNEREDIPQEIKDQLNANMVIREFDINFTSSLSEQDFNSLASLMGRGGCSIFWECGHYDYSCVLDKIECFNKLSNLEYNYGITIGGIEFDEVLFGSYGFCTFSPTEYDESVLGFLGLKGKDWEFDEDYWSDPSLPFPDQDIPSYQDFYDAFPKNNDGTWMYGADNIYNLVGGAVLQARLDYPIETQNTCALKISIALNGAGINIPNIPNQTLEGENGNYYFLNAASLTEWMKHTFGEADDDITHIYVPFSEVDDPNDIFPPNKGIFVGIYGESTNGPSGHADIYTGSGCSAAIDCYWNSSIEMHLWILN